MELNQLRASLRHRGRWRLGGRGTRMRAGRRLFGSVGSRVVGVWRLQQRTGRRAAVACGGPRQSRTHRKDSGGHRRGEPRRYGGNERQSWLQPRRAGRGGGWVANREGTLCRRRCLACRCHVGSFSRARNTLNCRKCTRLWG